MNFGILGSGSWGTALAKILTDNKQRVLLWNRNPSFIQDFKLYGHNPHYLSSVHFDMTALKLTSDADELFRESDVVIIAIPSSFTASVLESISGNRVVETKILSAVKGILPEHNMLLNDYLSSRFNFPSGNYFAVLGPCHAEEVAAEKLSYLTFAGTDDEVTSYIASCFRNHYLNTVTNSDIYGVQYASVLKNIYAVGSGMAHGLDYGDNFQSVFISNCAKEMASLLKISNLRKPDSKPEGNLIQQDYSASVYLGDLLVTCYSLYSRNRTLGNMIGKGYSVQSAKLEMNMIAEGYLASKCIHTINQSLNAELPIADTIYRILWEQLPARDGFRQIETLLV